MGFGAFLPHIAIGPTQIFLFFAAGKTFISYAVGNGKRKLEQDLDRSLLMLTLSILILIS